jgi:glycosyltransferase involved in cell wall biosynthesis
MKLSVSVLILTLNEENNLPRCFSGLSWCDDVIVLDSCSTDRTVEIAKKYGARVLQREFDNFASQRNYGLQQADIKNEWVLHLDADELVTEALLSEMARRVGDPNYDAYRIPSKMIFNGKWLRYSGMYPNYQVRLTRCTGFRFKQVGHGQKEDMNPKRIGTLEAPYIHYCFSKGISDWFEKHNRYSTQEAQESIRDINSRRVDWGGLVSLDAYRRRSALKGLSFRLPFRPLLRFIYMYFLRRGFLDGIAGFNYCCLMAIYEYMITLKIVEKERKRKRLPM